MRREERRRKFHEAVLSTLYPPPQPEFDEEPESVPGELFDVEGVNPEDFEEGDSGTSDDESGHQKLSRAQRKRLRKKKLKEEASRRGKLIGPLLHPSTSNDGNGGDPTIVTEKESQSIGQNAAEEYDAPQSVRQNACEKPEGKGGCGNQNKVKQRRMAKRVSKERFNSSRAENCAQEESFKSFGAENL